VSKKSLRVYFVVYEDGRRMGRLMRTWDKFFDRPAPDAYGATDDDVYAELETKLERLRIEDPSDIGRYLWDEHFEARTVPVDVYPVSSIERRPVIGKKRIPLVVSYVFAELEGGGFRVMLPRFGAWFVLEDLSLAKDVVRQVVSQWLLGENPRWVYDLRQVGDERVAEWAPPMLARVRAEGTPGESERSPGEEPPAELSKVADLLTERAARGKLAPVVGDLPAFAELAALSAREKPPSVLLVGASGVGKTALVRRLAMFHAAAKPPPGGRRRRLFSTSEARIVAGMVYLGMWQERCLRLVRELAEDQDTLHVDSLSGLLSEQPDGATIADFFEPAMDAGELRLIAECTEEELERARRVRPSFVRRFRLLRVAEPGHAETIDLVAAYALRRHSLGGPAATWKRLLRHAAALDRGVSFPGKALRFVDWLGQQRTATGTTTPPAARTLYPRDVSEAYSRYSGVPLELLSDDVPASATQLAAALKARVIGQDAACDACGRVLARFKATMTDPERPAGTLLFVGPTGVGKTELAKQLARTTFGGEDRIVRLDMSEYMLPGSSRRMLDSRPGQGSLAARVRQRPLSLVLLDEIEKAHPEVFDLLLGVLGEGRMTDDGGRFVDFRTTIVVMTSNVGVTDSLPAGFGAAAREDFLRPVRAFFRPEFVARVDHVLSFRALAPSDVERIVDLEIDAAALRPGFVRRALRLHTTSTARRRLAELGYHSTRGARPLRRLIEERVIAPIAGAVAGDPALRDRTVVIAAEGEPVTQPEALVVRVG
jgi:ATP-dependent Clp protease ATP-binding subunit ClpC